MIPHHSATERFEARGFPAGTHALAPAALHFVKPDGRSDAGAPAAPIPGTPKLPDTLCASFAATGRGWRHPTFTCRRPAPGRRARWLEIQGPVPTGSGESASNGGGAEARLQWLKADAAVTGSDPRLSAGSEIRRLREGSGPAQSGRPKNGTGHKTPRRGCRKAARCGGRKPSIGCGVGARATRRTLAGTAGGAGRIAPSPESTDPHRMESDPGMPSPNRGTSHAGLSAVAFGVATDCLPRCRA